MNFASALTKLINSTYRADVKNHNSVVAQGFNFGPKPTRDEVATSDRNVRYSVEMMGEFGVSGHFGDDVEFDTARPNSREYGITATVNGWTFFAYGNRITAGLTIEAMQTRYVKRGYASVDNAWAFGSHGAMQMPIGGDDLNAARAALIAMVELAFNKDNVSREELAAVATAVSA